MVYKLFTAEGDWVLDPFIGSGSTAEAAHSLGRLYTGVDLDPANVVIALDRMAKIMGNQPPV